MNTQLLRNLAEHANQLPPKDFEKLDYLIQKLECIPTKFMVLRVPTIKR
jgi:hypothetical protein